MSGGERCRLGESALDRGGMSGGGGRCRLGESALDMGGLVWGREMPTGRERTCDWKGMSGGGRHRLGESALESGREWCRGGRHPLGESALDRVGMVWGRKTTTGRERTLDWKEMIGGER